MLATGGGGGRGASGLTWAAGWLTAGVALETVISKCGFGSFLYLVLASSGEMPSRIES